MKPSQLHRRTPMTITTYNGLILKNLKPLNSFPYMISQRKFPKKERKHRHGAHKSHHSFESESDHSFESDNVLFQKQSITQNKNNPVGKISKEMKKKANRKLALTQSDTNLLHTDKTIQKAFKDAYEQMKNNVQKSDVSDVSDEYGEYEKEEIKESLAEIRKILDDYTLKQYEKDAFKEYKMEINDENEENENEKYEEKELNAQLYKD
eukprot:3448_1